MPGTYAGALRAAGVWRLGESLDLTGREVWYSGRFTAEGRYRLCCDGLAGDAELWLNGALLAQSANMFADMVREVTLEGESRLDLCFRDPALAAPARKGRAKWRTRLANKPWLRHVRMSLLGHMPDWSPALAPKGPWRPIRLTRRGTLSEWATVAEIRVRLDGETGRVQVGLPAGEGVAGLWVALDGRRVALADGGDGLAAEIVVERPDLWWPHSHGTPALYRLTLGLGDEEIALGPIGFRDIAVDRGPDGAGFGLVVNGVAVFCRGACWSPPDIVTLGGDVAAYRGWLEQARDAGMNMIRVGGTMVYEVEAFYRLCDTLGILVWQDFMFANHDYPADDGFLASVRQEAEGFLRRQQAQCCLAVLCGGSEIVQQAAMMGLDAEHWRSSVADGVLAEVAAAMRPDLPYVAHSPSGGAVPFQVNAGVGHYYGVGAYLQPLGDARRAQVRFATECLAVAHVPAAESAMALPNTPGWKALVARDPGSGWDFEDVRDHYLRLFTGLDPAELRGRDVERYLDLSRAVSCHLVEAVFGEWRAAGSGCAGGLVWLMRDLGPGNGAGWGVVDASGRAKPVWHAMRRAFAPVALALTDETVNGLALHLVNDRAAPVVGRLVVYSLREGQVAVARGEMEVRLEARSRRRLWLTELLGRFYDHTGLFRFGPLGHSVTVVHLFDDRGQVMAEAFHLAGTPFAAPEDVGLAAVLGEDGEGWYLDVSAARLAQFVHVRDASFQASDAWFHLSPLAPRRIRLSGAAGAPQGEVRATNHRHAVRYG